jgi:hypothetical protein
MTIHEIALARNKSRPTAAAKAPKQSPPTLRREYFCRQCDWRNQGNIPVGWWHLSRHAVEGSLPAPWDRRHSQPMGIYCSLECLLEVLLRLELLEADLKQLGVGLKKLKPGERPPALPAPVQKGSPR